MAVRAVVLPGPIKHWNKHFNGIRNLHVEWRGLQVYSGHLYIATTPISWYFSPIPVDRM